MWNVPTKERLDKIPRLYEAEEISLQDKQVHLHFFIFGSDWFVTEYDGKDAFWGFVVLNGDLDMAEFGYFSFQELKEISINGIEIDCEHDWIWKIRTTKEVELIRKANRWQVNPKNIEKGDSHGIHA